MKITIFGATGALGRECLSQSLDAGHEVTVLVRTAAKLPKELRERATVIEGDALEASDVAKVLPNDTEAILFAVGVVKGSPENLCTDVTRHILEVMDRTDINRLIWCGGGSVLRDEDQITFGAKFVKAFSKLFMAKKHYDKENQLVLLDQHPDVGWIGIRPLQMKAGPKKGSYRVGYDTFSGMSAISFADCAHAMVHMLQDDTWLGKAPIIQY
jgi:putative NADH-flavin reductase